MQRALRRPFAWSHLDRYVLGTAVRAAVVIPTVLALALVVLDEPGIASLAFFGALAMLVFADFDGPPRTRLLAYVTLLAAGSVLVVLGTLCSSNPFLAAGAMAVVGFGLLFAGILDSYVAAGSRAAILAFVLPAMVPVTGDPLSHRLSGWLLGGGVALLALALPWPRRQPDELRARVGTAIRALADVVTASASADPRAQTQAREASTPAIREMHQVYFGAKTRPTGTGERGAALGQLVEDVVWLDATPLPLPSRGAADVGFPEAEVQAHVTDVLGASARLIDRPAGEPPDLAALLRARSVAGDRFRQRVDAWRAGANVPLVADLDETFRLRSLSYSVWQLGSDALRVVGREPPDEPPDRPPRRSGERTSAVRDVAAAHATMRSVWLRNSVRGAVGLAIAVLVSQLADVHHSFWVVLGTLAVLRSQALTTGVTLLQDLAGTTLGIVGGGLLVYLLGTDTALLWALLVPVAVIAVYARKALSFLAGQAAFSFQMLIVFNLIQPSGWRIGLVRIEDVAIGAGISLLTALLLWPRGASGVLRDDLADAYERNTEHLLTTVGGLLDHPAASAPDRLAQAASASAERLDATLRQYLSERARNVSFDDLSVLVAGVTRLRRSVDQLSDGHQLLRPAPATTPPSPTVRADRAALRREIDALGGWYAGLADAIRRGESLSPPAAAGDAAVDLRLPDQTAGGADADELPQRLVVAWLHEHLVALHGLEPRLAAAAAALTREAH